MTQVVTLGTEQVVYKVYTNDTFNHEGILLYEDSGEIVIFNSCSHNGVINSIESARTFFPNKKIRSYVGGFHFPYPSIDKILPVYIFIPQFKVLDV